MNEKSRARERSNSLFFPIILIAAGVFWLLLNLGILPSFNWAALVPLWPILLIFLGLNLIVQQIQRPFGSLLSALLGLAVVGLFALAIGAPALLDWLPRGTTSAQVETATLDYRPGTVERAEVTLDTSRWPVEIGALSDGAALVGGEIRYVGELDETFSVSGGTATYRLATHDSSGWMINPVNWAEVDLATPWVIDLNPTLPTALTIDSGSGIVTADLASLTLSRLRFNSGSGSVTVNLPDGRYDADIDTGSGASTWLLPANGDGSYTIDSGSGAVTLQLPAGSAARIEVNSGSGAFRADNRFVLVDGDADSGSWETANYATAERRLLIEIDGGSGAITVEQPGGR